MRSERGKVYGEMTIPEAAEFIQKLMIQQIKQTHGKSRAELIKKANRRWLRRKRQG